MPTRSAPAMPAPTPAPPICSKPTAPTAAAKTRPVHMQAQRLRIDQVKQQLTLDGKVSIDYGIFRIEATHLRYDLKNAKVAERRGSKWTITPGASRAFPTRTRPGKGERP